MLKVSDSVTILRDGQSVETLSNNEKLTEQRIIKGMVGRDLTTLYPERKSNIGDIKLEVNNWTVRHPQLSEKKVVNDVSFYAKSGEVTGIAGLMGAGRTELMMSIFGKMYGNYESGTIKIDGTEVAINDVPTAIKKGLSYFSEDRKEYGLITEESVKRNISLANLSKLKKNITIDEHEEYNIAQEYKEKLNIKTPSVEQKVESLSGGNQQKIVLGKWIYTDPEILILDEPTRGIDIGAKNEIYNIINDLTEEGKSIIVISSELPELLGICDRIYTLSEGKITGEFNIDDADQEILMTYMTRRSE